MNSEVSSHRRILWATSVIGGATFVSLVIGLVRNKAVALIGGPEAIGLFGLLTAIMSTAGSIFTVGLDTSAVRQLAPNVADQAAAARVRWSIWTLALPLSLVGALAVWLFRGELASAAIGDAAYARDIGWLALGVAATVVSVTQIAIIQAYGRIGDVARIRVWSSVVATAVSVGAIYWFGTPGIVVAVLATPIANLALRVWLATGLPSMRHQRPSGANLMDDWRSLIAVGGAVMLAYTLANVTTLAIRSILARELGLEGAGLYHASAAIISVNLTIVLNAMATDYYPRISQAAKEPEAARAVVNQQLHVVLVLAGPILAIASVAAPLLLQLLYSGEFTHSSLLLRLLIASGILRAPIFALGYFLLGRGAGVSYLMGEIVGTALLPLFPWLIAEHGLMGAGIAIVLREMAICVVYVARSHSMEIRIDRAVSIHVGFLFAALLLLAFIFQITPLLGLIAGGTFAATLIWRSIGEVRAILLSGRDQPT